MSNCTLSLVSQQLSSANLDSYIDYVNKIPSLSREEEFSLAHRWRDYGDLSAAHKLVMGHLKYVVRVAKTYMGYGLALADLIQEGSIGLMKAVKKFQPERKIRLITFATHWIKSEIHEFVLRNWRIVKVATTKAQRKLFFKLRSSKKSLSWLSKNEASEMAENLEVKLKDVEQMEMRLAAQDAAFDAPADSTTRDDGARALLAPEDYLCSSSLSAEEEVANSRQQASMQKLLAAGLEKLDDRSLDIIKQRWLFDGEQRATLADLATQYGVSKERIRQIEKDAMKLLYQELEEAA